MADTKQLLIHTGPKLSMDMEKPKDQKRTIQRLLEYFACEKRTAVWLLLFVVAGVLCSVCAPKLQSDAIDRITEGSFGRLAPVLAALAAVYLLYGLCSHMQARLSAVLSQRIVRRLRQNLFEKVVRLPIQYIDNHSNGDLISRMTNDVDNVSTAISQALGSMIAGVFTIAGTIVMMLALCWQLALLSCTTILMVYWVTKKMGNLMRKYFRMKQELLGEMSGMAEEMITGYRTVTACNRQKRTEHDFSGLSDEFTKNSIMANILGGAMGPLMNVVNNIGFVLIAVFGSLFAVHGMISVGVISAFIVYAKQFGRPINELAQLYSQLETALAGAERVFEVLDEDSENMSGNSDLEIIGGKIEFEHVNFSYIPGKQVLYDFNFEVRAGQSIALVGETGSGKTSVTNLLMKFYDSYEGRILVDGVDIREIPSGRLRREMTVVLQEPMLFTDTIEKNLKYSDEELPDSEMEYAARQSCCAEMIQKMPEKYQTRLVHAGGRLSQGQRQLLSLGRAFLANPKILILDEATSSVDTRTEKQIQTAMKNLMKGRTSLIIAHRLSTIRDADCIIVLDQGRIVEMGTHRELLAQQGRYYELCLNQMVTMDKSSSDF